MTTPLDDKNLKVALVYDWVDKWGGAERLLLSLRSIFPQAPLFTSVYNPKNSRWASQFIKVAPSWLNTISISKKHELLTPLIPISFETFDFSDFDVVISVASAFAKGVVTKPQTLHICYCLAPTRFLWQDRELYRQTAPLIARPFLDLVSGYLRFWDQIAARRPDLYVSISDHTKQLVEKTYSQESEMVIYPPVDLETFCLPKQLLIKKEDGYFLTASRLVPYKKVDLVVKAFNHLGQKLLVVGVGSERKKLEAIAKPNIHFLGHVSDRALRDLYQGARALIVPQIEDYGLTALEANACGTPVLAYKSGGVVETIQKGISGEFFELQTPESLIGLIKSVNLTKFSPSVCRKNAERFSFSEFKSKWKKLLEDHLG